MQTRPQSFNSDVGPLGLSASLVATNSASIIGARYGNSLRAVIITGSMARNEATWVQSGPRVRVCGDAELLLVFHRHRKMPSDAEISSLRREIETALAAEDIACAICLNPVRPQYLTQLRPHIFAYELLSHGRVIWGDPNVLSLAPPFSSRDIPHEDAFCLLSNRVVEFIEALGTGDALYAQAKLYLDIATSYLLFEGEYASGYAVRAERLRARALEFEAATGAPLERVLSALDFKLQGSEPLLGPREEALRCAVRLADWELRRMAGIDAPRELLLRSWMRSQPAIRRIRGWAFTARACGWYPDSQAWVRWARLAIVGSPRYWVYLVAWSLASQLSTANPADTRALPHLQSCLPWIANRPAVLTWRELAIQLGKNYHAFLEQTRA